MNTTHTIKVLRLPAMPVPRGAELIALLIDTVRGLASALAPRRPPPRARDRVAEAAEVRELAYRVRASDPGFAADLFAAADRHELLDDEAAARR